MAPQQVAVFRTEASCRTNEITLLGTEHDSTYKPRRARPAHRSDDRDNQEKSLQRTNRQGQKCAKSEEKVEPRQGQKQLRDAHQSIVPPTAKVTCRRADAQANGQSTPRPQEAGEQRNLAAIQKPGELIPAVSIRSKQTNARAFRTEQV